MSPAAVAEKPLTAEEYAEIADSSRCTELVRGRIVEMPPPKPRHGRICVRIAALLDAFVDEHGSGRVIGNDSGVITERGPDTVRGAHIAFYSYARVPQDADLDDCPAHPPELVVELKSPTDRWSDMAVKVAEYLQAGVDAVCVLDPELQQTVVHGSDAPPRTLTADETLQFEAILPGFSVPVRKLFE